jgi:hypothetical protein
MILIGVVGGVLALIALGLWWAGRDQLQLSRLTADQLPNLAVGSEIKLVGQVIAVAEEVITIEMLQGGDFSQRTGVYWHIQRTGAEPIERGGAPEVEPQAIIQFEGTRTGPDSLRLARMIILTGVVAGPR